MFRVVNASTSWQGAYNEFESLVDRYFPDEDEIELAIRDLVKSHQDDPAYQEAYRRWTEGGNDSLEEIMDTLEQDGYDLDDPQDIMMGLGADLGYDREDAQAIFHQILMYRGITASTDITASRRTDDGKYLCRIARYGEFDNGHVLFGGWKKMTPSEAEDWARQTSIGHPDDAYYVKFDDIMDPTSGWIYVDGQQYSDSQVRYRGDHIEII